MNPILSQPPICDESVRLIDIVNSFSMFTNSSLIIYDYTINSPVYVNLSPAVNFKISNRNQQEREFLNHVEKQGLSFIKKVCETKNQFLSHIKDNERSNWVISGTIDNPNNCIIKDLVISFSGSTIAFTPEGNIRYELFKTFISSKNNTELTIFNSKTGERLKKNSLSGKWINMPILKFSDIEKQVLSLSIAGFSSKQIAEKIFLSEIAIKKVKSKIMHTMNSSTMTEAIFKLSHYRFL